MSADPPNEYLSDGMSEVLPNLLSQVSGLQVAARPSNFRYIRLLARVRGMASR